MFIFQYFKEYDKDQAKINEMINKSLQSDFEHLQKKKLIVISGKNIENKQEITEKGFDTYYRDYFQLLIVSFLVF